LTVNGIAGVVVPPGVVTVILRAPSVAVDDTLKVAVMVVELTTLRDPVARVTPAPKPPIVVPVAVKFVPVRVTGTARVPLAGCVAEFGLREARVGAAGTAIVNGTELVLPIGVVTPIFLAPGVAVAEIFSSTLTVEPPAPETILPGTRETPVPSPVKPVAPARLLPLICTNTLTLP
jgi:hypothetical protein